MLLNKQVYEVMNKLASLFDHTITVIYIFKKIMYHKYVEL
jgi:hypothetical protein